MSKHVDTAAGPPTEPLRLPGTTTIDLGARVVGAPRPLVPYGGRGLGDLESLAPTVREDHADRASLTGWQRLVAVLAVAAACAAAFLCGQAARSAGLQPLPILPVPPATLRTANAAGQAWSSSSDGVRAQYCAAPRQAAADQLSAALSTAVDDVDRATVVRFLDRTCGR